MPAPKSPAYEELAAIEDPLGRLRAVNAAILELGVEVEAISELRGRTIAELHRDGVTWPAIGAELGVTGERARQLAIGG